MYSVSDKYSKAIVSDVRDMPYRVKLSGAIVLDQSKIPNMTLTESASGNSGVSIGTANSASLKLTLRDAEVFDYTDIFVEPESGLVLPDGTIEWLPLGKFWVTNSSTSNDYKTVTLDCADGMYLMTGEFVSELTYPTTIKAFVNEIVIKTGVTFVGLDSLPNVIIRVKPDPMTFRDAIGYAAGCCGKNARFNREGNLEFFWYNDSGITIERETQYLNGMTRLNDKPLEVAFEVTGKKETYTITVITDGNGGATATPGNDVLEDDTVVLSVSPFNGYELAEISAVTESGINVTLYRDAEGGYTFIQPDSNVTVTAAFRSAKGGPFNLTVRAYDGGGINYAISENEAGYSYFNMGDTVTIFVTPQSGFKIDKLITTPANIAFSEAGTTDEGDIVYEFTMPQSDVTINAYFKEEDEHYTIERIVDQGGLSVTPGYVVIENYTTPGSLYKAGDVIFVRFARTQGHVFDYYEANVDMVEVDQDDYRFIMPDHDVSITAHFKQEDDESKTGQYSWLALPSNNTPPTSKPYWAVFYKHSTSVPTWQRFYLVWFDGWSVSGYESDGYGKTLYGIKFNGYYHCGSKNTGHSSHTWDTSTWSGNGASGSTLEWDATIGTQWASDPYYSGDYCLIASNVHLYYNSTLLFQMCPNAIQHPTESYLVDGMDVRERGAFAYYKCPDTFSTPAPASNWMIVKSNDSLLMDVDEDGGYSGYGSGWSGLYVVWFDDISVENVGAVFTNSEEEYYIARVTNGHYVALCRESGNWGSLRDIADNQVIGLRNPNISESASYSLLGTYYFNGLLSSSCNISSGGTLLRYKNDCKICDCVRTFSLRRSVSNTKKVTMTYTNPLIYEKSVPDISELVQGVTYTPAKVKHRGNPAFQVGDIVTVPDKNGEHHTILIMQQTMTFGGGMNSEITCPGQSEQEASFSANGPMTTQIKREVKQASAELEHRLSANNALVFASLHKTIGNTETKIESVVEWQTEKAATIAALEQSASEHEATIEAQAEILTETSHALASLNIKVDETASSIELIVEDGSVKGGVVIDAINTDGSTIRLTGNRLIVDSSNFQLRGDGSAEFSGKLKAASGDIGGWILEKTEFGNSFKDGDTTYKVSMNSVLNGSVSTTTVFEVQKDGLSVFYIRPTGELASVEREKDNLWDYTYTSSIFDGRIVSQLVQNDPTTDTTVVRKTTIKQDKIFLEWSSNTNGTASFAELTSGGLSVGDVSVGTSGIDFTGGSWWLRAGGIGGNSFYVGSDNATISAYGHWTFKRSNESSTIGTPSSVDFRTTVKYWSSPIDLSDKNSKNSIDDLSESYGILFDSLRPVVYRYNDGDSNRLHTGFIAQEVYEAMESAGLSAEEFACVCIDKQEDNESWGLRYSELIALCVKEIQKLKARIREIGGEKNE